MRSFSVRARLAFSGLTLASLVILCGGALASGQARSTTDAADTRPVRAILGGTLIDGTGRPARTNVGILIEGGRIVRVVSADEIKVSPTDRVIRADGQFILPGFIDAHVHYRDYFPELLIAHGITAVAEWGNSPAPWLLAQRDGVASGDLLGPRIYTAAESYSEEPDEQTPEKAREWLKRMIAMGVDKIDIGFASPPDVLKVLIDGGHQAGLPVSGYTAYSNEAIDLGIDAIKHTYSVGIASQTDPKVIDAIHAQAALSYRKRDIALPIVGADPSALARRMVAHHVNWVPTLVKDFKVFTDRRDEFELEAMRLLSNPNLDYLPRDDLFTMLTSRFGTGIPTPAGSHFEGVVEHRFDPIDFESAAYKHYREGYRNLQKLIKLTVDGGGHVLAGSAPHSYVLPGLGLHQEMQLFVDAGLTPMQVLQSAGLWVAQYLKKDRDLGSVEVGKLADLVLLDKNPLDDIRNTRSVRSVLQGGRLLPTGYHFSYRNPLSRSTRATSPGGSNPTPQLKALSVDSVARGGRSIDLKVSGDLFMQGALVYLDDVALETRYESLKALTAVVPPTLSATVGTRWVTVVNPPPGRSQSEGLPLIVKY
jgi:hypothetical protein